MNHYGVIMAGGGGTRFWPLSRQKTPKQLLNLSGKDLMVNEAIDRMSTVIERNNIFIITSEVQASAMESATVNKILKKNILAEPAARNTAACIGYSAMEIVRKYGDGVMIITLNQNGMIVKFEYCIINQNNELDSILLMMVDRRIE